MPLLGARRRNLTFGMMLAYTSCALLAPATRLDAAPAVSTVENRAYSYADLADLALTAQLVAGVTVTKAERLKGELAPGLAPDHARFLVEAATGMLLRGADGMPGAASPISSHEVLAMATG